MEGWEGGRVVYQSTDPAMKMQRLKYAQSDFSNRYRNRAGAICLVMKKRPVGLRLGLDYSRQLAFSLLLLTIGKGAADRNFSDKHGQKGKKKGDLSARK